MHFTAPVYRNPYWPTWPLIQITQGYTHNSCKFCTMYKNVPFRMQPMEWLEEDLKELRSMVPHAKTSPRKKGPDGVPIGYEVIK